MSVYSVIYLLDRMVCTSNWSTVWVSFYCLEGLNKDKNGVLKPPSPALPHQDLNDLSWTLVVMKLGTPNAQYTNINNCHVTLISCSLFKYVMNLSLLNTFGVYFIWYQNCYTSCFMVSICSVDGFSSADFQFSNVCASRIYVLETIHSWMLDFNLVT